MYQRTQRMGAATMMASPTTAVPPYDYADDEMDGEPPRRGRAALLWILGLLIVLGAVGALAYMLLGGGGKTYAVPLVQGEPLAKAEQQIAAAHLTWKVVNQSNSSVPKGDVINTNPPGGNNVAAGTPVTLFVSAGPKQVTVPNVQGQQASAAQNTLTNDGLNVVQKSDPGSTQPSGTVTRQSLAPGKTVPPNTTITIYVSGGAVPVPNVVGDSASTAQQILQGAGLTPVTKTVSGPASATPGTVFTQTPGAQSSVARNSTVTIYVAATPPSPTASPTPKASPTSSASPTPTPTPSFPLPGGGGPSGGN
jgi:serine/threonine-protein kinase